MFNFLNTEPGRDKWFALRILRLILCLGHPCQAKQPGEVEHYLSCNREARLR